MKRAVVFPGQGSQRPGMGRDLYESSVAARRLFDRADEILGRPLTETCFDAPPEVIHRTDVCQPAIFLVSAATLAVVRERGGEVPDAAEAAAGLSLGEYSALHFAGALSFDDGLRLTSLRGRLMQEASEARPSGMASVLGLALEAVEEVCARIRETGAVLCVANLNSPGQVVISGEKEALARAADLLAEAGARRTIPLSVAGAFHSPLMEPAAEGLAAALSDTEVRPPRIPVIANVTARPVADPDEVRQNLVRQLTSPVLWEASMRRLVSDGVAELVEPGPGTVLAGLMKKIDRNVPVRGYPDASSLPGDERKR